MANITEMENPISLKTAEAPNLKLDQWMKLQSSDKRTYLSMLRILGLIFDEEHVRGRGYTKSQIVNMLNIWEDQVGLLLDQLQSQKFIYSEQKPFGMDLFGRKRKIHVYHITEAGRFYVHQLDTQFPGIWTTAPIRTND
ncbi:MAG: hypothetical protein ACFFDT_23715, partial [Candidatus Hodarchaeota archaeon]